MDTELKKIHNYYSHIPYISLQYSILSILQMPGGVPVATVALNGAKNAGLLAAQIIGTHNETIALAMDDYKSKMENEVLEKVHNLKSNWENQFDA